MYLWHSRASLCHSRASLLCPCSGLSTTSLCDYYAHARNLDSRDANYLCDFDNTSSNPLISSSWLWLPSSWLPSSRRLRMRMPTNYLRPLLLLMLRVRTIKNCYSRKIICRKV